MNGQSRETGNIGHTRHRMKINKTKNTTQKKKDEHHGPRDKPGVIDCWLFNAQQWQIFHTYSG